MVKKEKHLMLREQRVKIPQGVGWRGICNFYCGWSVVNRRHLCLETLPDLGLWTLLGLAQRLTLALPQNTTPIVTPAYQGPFNYTVNHGEQDWVSSSLNTQPCTVLGVE